MNTYKWDILPGTDFQWEWLGDLLDDRISLMLDTQFEGTNNWAHFYSKEADVKSPLPESGIQCCSRTDRDDSVSDRIGFRGRGYPEEKNIIDTIVCQVFHIREDVQMKCRIEILIR